MEKKRRAVFCVGTWPENNYADFIACYVKDGETDEEAIERAKGYYNGPKEVFYIKEV